MASYTTFDNNSGKPERSTTIDIVLAVAGATELYKEEITFSCLSNGQEMLTLILHDGEKHRLEQLPTEGDFIIRVHDIRLNNIHYAFDECKVRLDGGYHEVAFNKERMRQRDDTDTDASKLILEVQTEKTLNRTFTLRLTDRGTPPRQYRFDNIPVQNGKNVQLTLVAPGSYQAMLTPLINDSIVYYIDTTPAPFIVSGKQPATLNVSLTAGACLQVKGFPGFLGFGGCANMSPGNADDFVEARVSSLFKYAGDDGMGDAGGFLPPEKEPTPKVIQLARDVSARLKDPVPVLPVMISYTCNLSLGDVEKIIRDPLRHKFSFANFIQALQMAQDKKTPEHPVPAGFIVNPDFLGECQKSGFSPTYPLPVRQPLKEALAHHKVSSDLPADITDTLKGYVKAVNWLARIIAPDVVIGWQVNLWGISGAQWIYKDFDYAGVYDPEDNQHKKMLITPQLAGEITAKYALSVGVFDDISSGDLDAAPVLLKGADFMAVDRYEADDFTVRSYGNGYCYSPYEWGRFFDFCASLSRHLRKPVMPWQIPASHLATTADQVGTNAGKPGEGIDEQHWGSGGSYLMGHPEIGTSVNAINTQLLDIKFIPAFVDTLGRNVHELFSRHPWNLSQPGYLDFPARGIFHVQLGGGATTGVVSAVGDPGNWVRTRLHTYRNHPVMFTARTEVYALQWTPSPGGDIKGEK